MPPELWTDYMWLVIMGAFMSFFMAFGIGANDVANSFGTTVGAKTITLKQACCIAAVFEFAGAIGLGGEVTKTIAGGIARPAAFVSDPEIFMFGMCVALFAAASWVYIATYMKLAVSTTHSIIGAIIGYALVWGGSGAVVWNDHMDEFPYSKGLVPVVCSWFVSPISAGIVAAFLFWTNRFFILRRENSVNVAIYCYPLLVGVTVFINLFFVFYKGAKARLAWDVNKAAWVAGACGGAVLVLGIFPGIWMLRWSVKRDMENQAKKAAEAEAAKDADAKKDLESGSEDAPQPEASKAMKAWNSLKKAATHGLNVDIHNDIEQDEAVHTMHAAAEVFDPTTEQVYKYLQVFSACAVSFAHGANDVANAVGPFASIWYVYNNWAVPGSNAASPYWILAMGGAGIVVGLATFGYNIMATLGVGMAKFTPSRGYCAELATSFTVALASVYGLPVSTTQCITGAEFGVGITENIKTGVNYKLFGKQVLAWVFTLIVAGLVSAAVFAMGVYSPSLTMAKDLAVYEQQLKNLTTTLYKTLNTSNIELNKTFSAFDATLNSTIASNTKTLTAMYNTKVIGYIDPNQLMQQVDAVTRTYMNYSVIVTGFNRSTRAYTNPASALLVENNITVAPFTPEQLKVK